MDGIQLPIGLDTANLRAFDALKSRAVDARSESASGADTAETAKKFESVFATLLVKEMRRSLGDGFFGEGADGDIYSGWLDEHVGQTLAERDALHMREMIERSVLNKSEVAA
jgi:Rod binding domain-containing protein